ncbi:probable NAD(P)H dehydrogenase subunit CRR3, chloroplastic isoform X1 [Dioscorea cayenensis subsp. rotundata]|uniref:Probable NAD(P)H dehydrogenase subunit CRR3, chloroplastic isoform X1 n=1 Tax=Dioscorea cayennensis subsp. rotundata TaxID=55577 RepID=A0AB40BEG3_DIOCR|nr:probable NAD(P)H dehydrogenase subunit CRR3, chloroplastic isoform X1 [Dioscorea cayenensis subsp. rotundata]
MIFSSTPKPRRTMPQVLASKSMASSFNQKPINNQEMKRPRKKKINESPTIAEIERVIGIKTDEHSSSPSSTPSLLQMLATESPAEKKLRETAEWIVEKTEDRALVSQKILILFFIKILPFWILLLVVASGLLKLPFDIPFFNDLFL